MAGYVDMSCMVDGKILKNNCVYYIRVKTSMENTYKANCHLF